MKENSLIKTTQKNFEQIKHIDDNGVEFWYARELMSALGYSKWGNFKNVIDKAKKTCKGSNIAEEEHFADVGRVLKVGNNAEMKIDDIKLTRYACYIIAQNGDSRKETIALAQTDEVLKNKKVNNEDKACKTHYDVGQAVRQVIKKIGGTMPEDSPTPEKSTKQLEKERKLKKINNKKLR